MISFTTLQLPPAPCTRDGQSKGSPAVGGWSLEPGAHRTGASWPARAGLLSQQRRKMRVRPSFIERGCNCKRHSVRISSIISVSPPPPAAPRPPGRGSAPAGWRRPAPRRRAPRATASGSPPRRRAAGGGRQPGEQGSKGRVSWARAGAGAPWERQALHGGAKEDASACLSNACPKFDTQHLGIECRHGRAVAAAPAPR